MRQGSVWSMSPDSRTELRALALWHTRRRNVDELLTPLLEYGPVAVDRVADRLDELATLAAEEVDAFQAFVSLVRERNSHDAVVLEFARVARPDAE